MFSFVHFFFPMFELFLAFGAHFVGKKMVECAQTRAHFQMNLPSSNFWFFLLVNCSLDSKCFVRACVCVCAFLMKTVHCLLVMILVLFLFNDSFLHWRWLIFYGFFFYHFPFSNHLIDIDINFLLFENKFRRYFHYYHSLVEVF